MDQKRRQREDDRVRFRAALDALEAAASEPIVAGESAEWSAGADALGADLEAAWAPYRQRLRDTFSDIERNDLSLQPRVQELRQGGRRLEQRLRELRERLSDVVRRGAASESPPDDDLARQAQSELRVWAAEVRELDSAATTWLIESVFRDRGVVD